MSSVLNQKNGKTASMERKSRRISRELKSQGRWLALSEVQYKGHDGEIRKWECAERVSCAGAVAIIALLKPSGRLILVRQYRPPVDAYVIEFPAGLVDRGEDPAQTAVRELKEETGYEGRVVKMLPPAFNSPGLTGESVWLALMEVDEKAQGDLATKFDESESIETISVKVDELPELLAKAEAAGDKIDAKTAVYSLASSRR